MQGCRCNQEVAHALCIRHVRYDAVQGTGGAGRTRWYIDL